jgi:hypothetical protein
MMVKIVLIYVFWFVVVDPLLVNGCLVEVDVLVLFINRQIYKKAH